MAAKRRIVSPRIAEDGTSIDFNIYSVPDATGAQQVADTLTFPSASVADTLQVWFMAEGVRSVASNRWNALEDGYTPADVRAALDTFLASVTDGTFTPGRVFESREPTDLELAIAEATGTPVADLLDRIENEVQLNADGTPKVDARGRRMRVFTQRVLADLGNDPAVKPILARLVAERAKRLSAEAKRGNGTASTLGKLFGPTPTAEPAPEAAAAQ